MIGEKNKLIAEFMGAKDIGGATIAVDGSFAKLHEVCISQTANYKQMVKYYDKPTENQIHSIEDLQYHTSWDWLMPVVEKIESLGHVVAIIKDRCQIGLPSDINPKVSWCTKTKIDATYNAVVEFINNQPKQF